MADEEKVKEAFAKTLKDLRNKSGLTQEKLAWKTGLDPTYIGMLERSLRQPTLTTIIKIARALDITPGKIVDDISIIN